MSKIVEYREQITRLMAQLVSVERAYAAARLIYDNATACEDAPTSDVGALASDNLAKSVEVFAQVDDVAVLLPLPQPEALADLAASAASAQVQELARIWRDVQSVTHAAVEHLNAAVTAAQAEAAPS